MSWERSRRALSWTGIRFLIVGVANTFFGLSIIFLGKWLLGLGDISANALGYGLGLLLSFFLNAKWTFVFHGNRFPAMIRFVVVIATAYGVNLAIVMTAIDEFGINSYFSQMLGIIPYTAVSYLGMRHLVFPIANCKPAEQNSQ